MANLTRINEGIAATKRRKKAKKKPVKAPEPPPERIIEKATDGMAGMLESFLKRLEAAIQAIGDRPPPPPVVIDEEKIGKAVAKQFDKLPRQDIKLPERKPLSYYAKIERRGNQMIGARIDPIIEEG